MKKLELCTEPEAKVLVTMTGRHLNAVRSTSAGRLFDGVSAILGIRKKSTFEGEASTALEFAAEAYEKTMQHPYEPLMLKPFTETAEDRLILNTGELAKNLAKKTSRRGRHRTTCIRVPPGTCKTDHIRSPYSKSSDRNPESCPKRRSFPEPLTTTAGRRRSG